MSSTLVLHHQNRQRYTKLEKLGEGNYGAVYKGWDCITKQLVALKRLHLRDKREHSLPGSTLREIYTLRELEHPGIVQLLDVVFTDSWQIYMVFECLESDLKQYIELLADRKDAMTPMLIKSYLYQMLSATAFCHQRRLMHRDLKPDNILLNSSGGLKIADFGLARSFTQLPPAYTHNVITLWYRAPEVLLGASGVNYSTAVDMWSVGCILGEMLICAPVFSANFEIQQILKIFQHRGTPVPVQPEAFEEGTPGYPWPGVDKYPNFSASWPKWPRVPFRQDSRFACIPMLQLDNTCLDLLDRLLAYDPTRRLSAQDAMLHPFFDDYTQLRRDIDVEECWKRRRVENPAPNEQVSETFLRSHRAASRSPRSSIKAVHFESLEFHAGELELKESAPRPVAPGSAVETPSPDGSPEIEMSLPDRMRRLSLPGSGGCGSKRLASQLDRDLVIDSGDSEELEHVDSDSDPLTLPEPPHPRILPRR